MAERGGKKEQWRDGEINRGMKEGKKDAGQIAQVVKRRRNPI